MRDFFHKKHPESAHVPPGYRFGKRNDISPALENKISHWKHYAKLSIIALTFLGSIGLLLFHPFFQIHSVQIQGLQRIKEGDIRDTVNGILSYKRFFVFPQNNFFVVDINDLHAILEQKFALKKLSISKKFPHTLDIRVEEKLSSIIYDNGEQYSMIDANGKVSEILRIVDDSEWRVIKKRVSSTSEGGTEVSTEQIISRFHSPNYKKITSEVGESPLLYDTRNKKVEKGAQVLDENTVHAVIQWYEILKQNTDLPITYFYLEHEVGNITIKTSEGWNIKAKLDTNIVEQFQTLQYLLQEKVKRGELQYIDVRFPGRAFWL